jgi:two-component system chemotaxis sensor kinase CheA
MTIDMSQFYKVFFDEAEELLAEKEKLLLSVNVASPDGEDLNAIFRAAHSIKGGASTFGLNDMSEVTHILESLLDKIRKGEMTLTPEHVDAFLATKDVLKMQLDGHRIGTPVDLDMVADVRMLLQSFVKEGEVKPDKFVSAFQIVAKEPLLEVYNHQYRIVFLEISESDFATILQEFTLLGATLEVNQSDQHFVVLQTNSSADDILAICSFILDVQTITITPEEVLKAKYESSSETEDDLGFGFFDPLDEMFPVNQTQEKEDGHSAEKDANNSVDVAIQKQNGKKEIEKAVPSQETSTIRVGIEKVDQIINLIGELVITQAMLAQQTKDMDPVVNERLINSVGHLNRNTRELQDAVMSIRMMPMDYVFSRFPRMVRDLANKLGKKVEFITFGSSTELDKGLIEKIVDPLTHLVRNSIDHGVELPAMRTAAGKSEVGKLSLSASHQGGNIIIEVSDDGGGLNREKILEKAKQSGLPLLDKMSDSDVWQLIFAPGFSTAEEVTDVSGRGVGMDVVKRNITQMGGAVDIKSARGFGTTITISLPLTLAILDGMSVRVGDEIYILPLSNVAESLQPLKEDVKEISGEGRLIKIRQEYLPLVALHQYFSISPKAPEPWDGIVVVVEVDGQRAAIFVDDLVGQQQVVVKNIESNYRKIPGVAGATILGDGGVSFILDVAALVKSNK